ncbi:MAG TPA: hypothetical protein DCP02_06545, partial [Actinobacteria bacterium]|nr:hypothetical protein [Actinomycetota bacterium]
MDVDLKIDSKQISSAMDLVPIGIMIVDSKTHKIVDVNKAYSSMVGISRDKTIGRQCNHLNICSKGKELCTGMGYRKKHQEIETSLIDINGNEIPVLRKIITYNSNGNSYYLECIFDLGAYNKKTESRIKDLENKFRVIFEDAPNAYYLSDLNGNFIDGNKAAEDLVKYKRKELIGKSFLKLKLLPLNQIVKAA